MQANSSVYRQRLMRMRTLGEDFRFAGRRPSVAAAAVREAAGRHQYGAAAGGDRSDRIDRIAAAAAAKDKGLTESSISGKSSSGSLWMRQPQHHRQHHRHRHDRRSCQAMKTPQALPSVPRHHSPASSSSNSTATVAADSSSAGPQTCLETQTLMDMQTNNSRKHSGGGGGACNNANSYQRYYHRATDSPSMELHDAEESDESEPEFQNSNAATDEEDISNENAVAKGANALVKQATSRQTEIIDTSKLLEEGKVETQYEEPEDEPEEIEVTDTKLIDEYEKTFAYARRLRALLNMQFKVMDKNSIETNFLMVKAHEHPTQKVTDRWRNVDLGHPYDGQIRQKKLVDDFKQTCGQKKKPKKGQVVVPVFPDWIKFCFRFKKDAAEKRWTDFTAYRQRMKKLSGGKVSVPKPNDRYMPGFYDIWSTSVVVFAKPETTLLNMVDPVFAKLGLEARADFKFTVGCFEGDKRSGKAKVQGAPSVAEEVAMQAMCGDLYRRNCWEIFVNDNRIEMFKAFPSFFAGGDAANKAKKDKKDKKEDGKDKKDKKDKKDSKDKDKKGGKNQSNLETDSEAGGATANNTTAKLAALARSKRRVQQHQLQHQLRSGGDDSRQGGDTTAGTATATAGTGATATKVSIAEEAEAALFDSSPSATNQNLSVHDCDSSEDSQCTREAANSTTKSGRTETTRRD